MNFYNPKIAPMEVELKQDKDDSPKNEEKKNKNGEHSLSKC